MQELIVLHHQQQSVDLPRQQQGPAAPMKTRERHPDLSPIPVQGPLSARHEDPGAITAESLAAFECRKPRGLAADEGLHRDTAVTAEQP